jgi:hypothetical protein
LIYLFSLRATHAEEEGGKSEENLPLTAGFHPHTSLDKTANKLKPQTCNNFHVLRGAQGVGKSGTNAAG